MYGIYDLLLLKSWRKHMPSRCHALFKEHLSTLGHLPESADWERVCEVFEPVEAKRSDTLLDSAKVAADLFYVCEGVAASFQTTHDGERQIARFFEAGQVCSNITSAWQKTVSEDELIALTDFVGLRIPFETFRSAFLHGGLLDTFWREAIFETLLFDKDILCAKTIRDVGTRYRFLATRYATVIGQVPDRDIARFLGITPQWLSRFLRNNRGS